MVGLEGPADDLSLRRSAGARRVLLSASGLAYLILDSVGNSVIASLPGAPAGDDADVASFFDRHEATIGLMAWIVAIGAVFLAIFAVTVRRSLPDSIASDLVAASGLVAAAILTSSSGVLLVGVGQTSPQQAKVFWDLWNAGLVATLPAAAMAVATSVATRREAGRPAWIWLTGFPLALLCLVPWIAWVNLKLFPLWIGALSVSLLRGRRWGSAALARGRSTDRAAAAPARP